MSHTPLVRVRVTPSPFLLTRHHVLALPLPLTLTLPLTLPLALTQESKGIDGPHLVIAPKSTISNWQVGSK